MNLHFTICPLASVVLVLVILVNIFDIYLVGTNLVVFIINAVISVIMVWVANKTCFKWHWVSWVLVAYLAISVFAYLMIIINPKIANEPTIVHAIEKDRAAIAGANNGNKDAIEGNINRNPPPCRKPDPKGCCGPSGPRGCPRPYKTGCC